MRLGDCCKTNLHTYSDKEKWSLIRYLDTGSITEGRIDEIQTLYPGVDKIPSRARRKASVGDILFSTVRPNQKHYGIIEAGTENLLVSTGFTVVTVDTTIADPYFIYYYLTQSSVIESLQAIAEQSTSTYPSIKPSDIEDIELDLPELETQKKIGSTLRMLDRKIALNEEINDNLAVLLQTIYQDRFGNDILAVNQGVLSDICSYSRDKVAVSELNVSTYFSTENMLSEKAGSTEATSLPTTSQTTACHKGDTLISNIRPYFKKIVYCEGNCGCSTDVLCFTPSQPRYSTYLFSTLYADKFFAFMVAGSKGTKMPRGDKQQIMTYPVVLPSEEELAGFNTIASPLLKQIYSNRAENKRLSILRDTLLPKLMSGEIDVSAVQL